MRIDGTTGYDAFGPLKGRNQAARNEKTGSASGNDGSEVVISGAKSEHVAQAKAAPAVRTSAVEEAKRLLNAGELDTPDAIQRAADSIIERGI